MQKMQPSDCSRELSGPTHVPTSPLRMFSTSPMQVRFSLGVHDENLLPDFSDPNEPYEPGLPPEPRPSLNGGNDDRSQLAD